MISKRTLLKSLWLPLLLTLAACQPPAPPGVKIGKPYEVEGKTYVPRYDPSYDQVGEASWYGPGFHGKYTANGEVYDQHDLTAAHPTLPMPSLVRVTNLKTGVSQVVRINDRGPFKSSRIIDLSKGAAQALGIKGIAQVRVQYMKAETEEYIAALPNSSGKRQFMALRNAREDDDNQIVESTDSNTSAGQTISDAAPIMTVSSGELGSPLPPKKAESDKGFMPQRSSGLIRQAYADEDISRTKEVVLYRAGAENEPPEQPPPRQRPDAAFDPPKADRGGGYYVQAGVFSQEENANRLVSSLGDENAADISKYKGLWRVRLGPYGEMSQTKAAIEKLRAAGVADARVVNQ